MRRLCGVVFAQFIAASALLLAAHAYYNPKIEWAGKGRYRMLVKVDPVRISGRTCDEMPAEVVINFVGDIAKRLQAEGKLDVTSIQIIKYDPVTGRPLTYGKYAYAATPYDLPFRWYDNAIPYNFPEFERNIDATDGEIDKWNYYPKWGYFYETVGDWEGGHLAWVHTQEGNRPSYYAIYFELLQKEKQPDSVPPRGFLGDGMERCEITGASTTGLIHSRVAVDDWNDDGLADLVIGCARGGLIWYPNIGTKTEPKFSYSKMIFMADGKPLDVGWSAAPAIVDWDGDGAKDVIAGAEWNRLLFFKNIGTNKERKFVNKGFVKAKDKPIILPHEPNPEGRGVFPRDYYPVPEAVDWDGDGDLDLLLGGYVTGMIFYYENVGKEEDGSPVLKYRGPLEADGKPIDVGWAAAPCAADFDGDGDLDLISGSMPMTAGGGDSASSEKFLYYFENVGARTAPALALRPFPKRGEFPYSALGTPRAVDLNSDGLLDLVVSAGTNVYLYKNIGTKMAPLFEAHANPLPSFWSSAPIDGTGLQFIDWNGDGLFDILSGLSVYVNKGRGNPGIFSRPEPILPPGQMISHPAPVGDEWMFVQVADLDADGRPDILFGDHGGNIYFHKNLSTTEKRHFDAEGAKLEMSNGKPIKVGPEEGQDLDFDVLQGARTAFAIADFDKDGKLDLVVGDTYGKMRFYKNMSTDGRISFADPVLMGDMGTRVVPTATDWNSDGWIDVIGAAASGAIQLFLNRGKATFASGQPLKLPAVPYGPRVSVVDWNGDGDEDLIIATAYGYFCLVERSYLEHGYARGRIVKVEKRI